MQRVCEFSKGFFKEEKRKRFAATQSSWGAAPLPLFAGLPLRRYIGSSSIRENPG